MLKVIHTILLIIFIPILIIITIFSFLGFYLFFEYPFINNEKIIYGILILFSLLILLLGFKIKNRIIGKILIIISIISIIFIGLSGLGTAT